MNKKSLRIDETKRLIDAFYKIKEQDLDAGMMEAAGALDAIEFIRTLLEATE